MPHIRPIALAVVHRRLAESSPTHALAHPDDALLVFEAVDRVTGETFYRPLGGGIEFGETAEQAVRRELIEELNAPLGQVRLIGVLENIFRVNGRDGHEIAFMFEADLADASLYERDQVGFVGDIDEVQPVTWQPLARFAAGDAPLYPAGLPELLGLEAVRP